MTRQTVRWEVDADGVLTVVLCDPSTRNALDDRGFAVLEEALARARTDTERVRVVHLRGEAGSFCSGAHVTAPRRPGHPLDRMRWLNGIADSLRRLPQPVVAEVDGDAVGAGLGIVLHSDLVVATPRSRFSAIFVRRALSPDFGVAWGLTHAVGAARARRMCLTGELVPADVAEAWGLVGWLVEDDIATFTRGLVDDLVAAPPVALHQTKALMHQAAAGDWLTSLEREAAAVPINLATDAMEARQAFGERREPDFDGRWKAS
jgi:enoyl-CoA hydratase/carnithine racemase